MHSYETLKKTSGNIVSQTVDSPIMIFDVWELSDAMISLLVILVFGVLFYTWDVMLLLLCLTIGVGPWIKRHHNRGIYLHWPYKKMHISLPGLINPKGRRKYSD